MSSSPLDKLTSVGKPKHLKKLSVCALLRLVTVWQLNSQKMGKRDKAKGEKINEEDKGERQHKGNKGGRGEQENKGKKEEKEICHSQSYASSRVPCSNQDFLWCCFSKLKGATRVPGALVEGKETAYGCSGGLEEEFICLV